MYLLVIADTNITKRGHQNIRISTSTIISSCIRTQAQSQRTCFILLSLWCAVPYYDSGFSKNSCHQSRLPPFYVNFCERSDGIFFFRFFLSGICSFARFRISPKHWNSLLCTRGWGITLGGVYFFCTVTSWVSQFSCNMTWFSVARFDGAWEMDNSYLFRNPL